MAHEINYDARYSTELERREAALNDLRQWLGEDRYKNLCQISIEERDKGTSRLSIQRSAALFLGISGYPIDVLLDFLGFPQQTPNSASGTAQTQANSGEVG